jgi:tetratricopeptide (TPR) repeat protein
MFRLCASKERRAFGFCGAGSHRSVDVRRKRVFVGVLGGLVAAILAGCGLGTLVEPERALSTRPQTHYETTNLAPRLLEERIQEIDASFTEPRTPAKVALSLETSLASISPINGYAALWRATRACAWLAENHTDPRQRGEYAEQGYGLGASAVEKVSNRVESFYYLARCQMALAEYSRMSRRRSLNEAENNLKIALALDPSFDSCGPDRSLGELLTIAHEDSLATVRSQDGRRGVRGAVEHLEKATNDCPDYGANRLAYAQALLVAKEYDHARAELEAVLASSTPVDRSGEHDRWLGEANELLIDLVGK